MKISFYFYFHVEYNVKKLKNMLLSHYDVKNFEIINLNF